EALEGIRPVPRAPKRTEPFPQVGLYSELLVVSRASLLNRRREVPPKPLWAQDGRIEEERSDASVIVDSQNFSQKLRFGPSFDCQTSRSLAGGLLVFPFP